MPPDGSGRIYSATYSNVPVYKFNVEGNHVMRRRADDWINATHILKVADFDKLTRTRILEREVQNGVHEKVQGGYGKYQGTWIPLHEGRVLAERNGVLDKLLPIFDFIPGDRSPPPAPKHATAASSRPKAARRSLGRRAQVAYAAASQVREDHYEGESAQYADAETPDNVTIAVSEMEGGRERKRDADQLSAQDRTHQIWADALLDSQRLPPAKKPKAAKPLGCFPNFDDSDVAISVGDLELKLHSQTLCDTCDYFAEFNSTSTKFPERFALKPSSLSLGNDANQTLAFAVVSPTGSDSNDVEAADDDDNSAPRATTPTSDARMKRTRAANEAIFRLLYRQPLSCARPTDFRDAAALATRYGCMNKVKDALVSAILKASLGTTLFRDDPWALLNAGYNLRDEAIFSEALLHVVGRGGGGGDELLPSGVADLVDKHLADLEAKVKTCWQDALRCCRTDSIPRAFATTLMRSYVDQHVACALGSPLRPEVYKVLAALHHMANIKPLLHADLMASVDEVDDALVASQTFINNQDSDRCYDAENYDNTIHILNEGLDQCVNRQSVEGELRSMLQGIKEVIKPLFVGDRNIGYFTCMHFAGPFPWPNTPPSSP